MQTKKIEKFEDLIVWQKARELTQYIYRITKQEEFSKDFGLRDQLRRAPVSIISNIAEGIERGGRSEFHHFLVIAKGSCAELRSQLYASLDADYIDKVVFKDLYSLSVETSRLIGGLRAAIYKQKKKNE
jgi:four helix bundle protein